MAWPTNSRARLIAEALDLVALACLAPHPLCADVTAAAEVASSEQSVARDVESGSFDIGLGFGPVFPLGTYADNFSTGFGGHGSAGITSGRLGVRLMMGSDEPATRDATNQRFSALLGQPVKVQQAIVPVELQALYRFPLGRSPMVFGVQAGMGGANVTVRLQNSDARLSDTWHFDTSAGISLGVKAPRRSIIAAVCEYRHVFRSPDPTPYVSTQLELTFPLF